MLKYIRFGNSFTLNSMMIIFALLNSSMDYTHYQSTLCSSVCLHYILQNALKHTEYIVCNFYQ